MRMHVKYQVFMSITYEELYTINVIFQIMMTKIGNMIVKYRK